MTEINRSRWHKVLSLNLFLFLALWQIELPGLQFDECMSAAPAVVFLYGSETEPMQIDPSVVYLAGRPLPMMLSNYIGPVKIFAHLSIYVLFGVSVLTTRLAPVLLVLAAIWFFQLVLRQEVSEKSGNTFMLLAASHSALNMFLTRDVGPYAVAVFLFSLALWLFFGWMKSKSLVKIACLGLVLGLGVSHKADFVWYITGLGVAAFAIYRPALNKKEWAWLLGMLVLGGLPMLLFNLATGFLTLKTAGSSFSFSGLWQAVLLRNIHIIETVSGVYNLKWFTGAELWFWLELAIWGALWTFCVLFKHAFKAFVMIIIAIIILFSLTSHFAMHHMHLLILVPLFLLLASPVRFSSVLAVPFLTISILINYNLRETGGKGVWSDAIYEVAKDLEGQEVNLYSHRFTGSLIVLTKGKIKAHRTYLDQNDYNKEVPTLVWGRVEDGEIIKTYYQKDGQVFATLLR